MRIVAGLFRGRRLHGPTWEGLRPTSDKLRESVFNILAHAYGDPITDARVLDLFAGTGALGCEALSRGAKFALFVDDGAEARGLIRANVEALSLTGVTKIFRRDASKMGEIGALAPFDLAFCDPPYGKGLAEKSIASARAAKPTQQPSGSLNAAGIVAAFGTSYLSRTPWSLSLTVVASSLFQ